MGQLIQAFVFIVIAVILLWFGYTLFFGISAPVSGYGLTRKPRLKLRPRGISYPGAPQTCPVCSSKLIEGELVKSLVFPSISGGKDRFMHIKGCLYCLYGEQERVCPVCGHILWEDEILICRMFERQPSRGRNRPHVHVLGCTHCRGI